MSAAAPESSSVKEVMKGGGVNVNPPCSKLPVEDAMASDAERSSQAEVEIQGERSDQRWGVRASPIEEWLTGVVARWLGCRL